MIAALMASQTPSARRISPATAALAAAAVLVTGALGYRFFVAGDADDAPVATNNMAAAPAPPSVEDMIAGLRERLRQDPDNHEGWYLLGMAYRDSGSYAEAEQAFRRAMELAPQNADYAAYLGETLVLRSEGNPPPEAERMFRRALELEADNAQARYYLATMKDLRGDHQGAINDLIALLRAAPAGAVWEPQVRQAVTSIAREHDIDIEGRLPPPQTPPQSPATAGIPGPTREQMEQARTIPPSQQDEMVKGMVDRLAERLRANPRDEARWIMLMRSRMVLNEPQLAAEALRSGLAAFANDAATQNQLRQAARELGVPAT